MRGIGEQRAYMGGVHTKPQTHRKFRKVRETQGESDIVLHGGRGEEQHRVHVTDCRQREKENIFSFITKMLLKYGDLMLYFVKHDTKLII